MNDDVLDTQEQPETTSPVEVISVEDLLDHLAAAQEVTTEEATEEVEEAPPEPLEVAGTAETLQILQEIRQELAAHPLLTTPFAEYTVTEGLLLLLLLAVFLSWCGKLLRSGFSWLW